MRLARFLLVLTVGWCAPAQSPATFSMTGTVQDSSTAGIPGAAVVLKKAGETVGRVATADGAGTFRFDNVTP
jgi:hypothetical protein